MRASWDLPCLNPLIGRILLHALRVVLMDVLHTRVHRGILLCLRGVHLPNRDIHEKPRVPLIGPFRKKEEHLLPWLLKLRRKRQRRLFWLIHLLDVGQVVVSIPYLGSLFHLFTSRDFVLV